MKIIVKESSAFILLLPFKIFLFIFLLQSLQAQADTEGFTGPVHIKLPPISQEALERELRIREPEPEAIANFTVAADSTAGEFPVALDEQTVEPEIVDLARALRHNSDLIYQFVHDQIEFEPLFGTKKGAVGALIDKRGNAFDQAALMVKLLRASGYSASYVYGKITPSDEQLKFWVGGENRLASLRILSTAGIPTDSGGITHVWVKVNIDGDDYMFDPAFKQHSLILPSMDIGQEVGYNKSTFMNAALEGATQEADYIQNVNQNNIKNWLNTYSSKLILQIKKKRSEASLEDIIGGKTIIPDKYGRRQATLPYQASITEVWIGEIPERYQTKLHIQHLGIDVIYNTADIYGKRLTIRFNDSMQPELRLEGGLQATGNQVGQGAQTVHFTITHPNSGLNRSKSQNIEAGIGYTYLVSNGWGKMSKGMLEKHQRMLSRYLQKGKKPDSEAVLGENLMLISSHWIIQNSMANDIIDALAGVTTARYNWVGIAGQNTGPYVDLPLNSVSIVSLLDGGYNADSFFSIAGTGSALEHAVIEQAQDMKAVSTVQLLTYANSQSYKIYDLNKSNFSTIRPKLSSSYSKKQLDNFESKIRAGSRIILPEEGQLDQDSGDSWKGYGALVISQNEDQITHEISGGLKGGFSRQPLPPVRYKPVPITRRIVNTARSVVNNLISADPIDLVTGDFLYDHDDLTLGPKALPFGFGFQRHYSSSSRFNNGILGYGWSHSFDISVKEDSNAYQALGEDSPIDAAAATIATYVSLDILQGQKTKEKLLVLAMIEKWMTDQLTKNAVNINTPGSRQQYIKLPDGNYNPPPGQIAQLTKKSDGGYSLKSANGAVMDFNANGKIQEHRDSNNNVLVFQYNNDGLVENVHNGFNRNIVINYQDKKIREIKDHTGRKVSYEYDGSGNLVKYTDANGHMTRYVYDLIGRLTQVFTPDFPDNPQVTNVYDQRDKVIEQTNGDNHVYRYYFAGSRSEEVDPQSHSKIWYYDKHSNPISTIDQLKRRTVSQYDGQQRLIERIFPEGNEVKYEYDNSHRVIKTVSIPKPGGGLGSIEQINTYEDTFNKLSSTTDALGRTTNLHYDDHGNLLKIEHPAVDGVRPTQTFTYNSRGQVFSETDAEGRLTHFINDGFADLVKVVVDPGGNNLETSFSYDGVGNLISQTDPKQNTITFKYDQERNLISTKSPAPFNYITENQYNQNNQIILTRQQTGSADQPWQTIKYQYNRSDKVTRIISPGNRITENTYDGNNRLVSMIDPEGRVTDTKYNAAGEVVEVSQMLNDTKLVVAEYSYNKNGQQKTITDANANITQYSYDGFGRLRAIIYPDNSQEKYSYDEVGNMLERLTRAGQKFSYQYDALNRLRIKTLPNGNSIQYEYDLTGRRILVSKEGNDWNFQYDDLGRLIETENPVGKLVQYGYDANNNQNLLVYPDGYTITYEYDPIDRLTVVKDADSNLVKYRYDALSRKVGLNYGNGTHTDYLYNISNDLIVIDHSHKTVDDSEQLEKFVYQYNQVGEITLHNNTLDTVQSLIERNSKITSSYESNALNQYRPIDISIHTPLGAENHTAKTRYDANGNLLTNLTADYQFEHQYQYDSQNQLAGVKVSPAGNNFRDSVTYRYDYDPMGRRIAKTIAKKSGRTGVVNQLIPDDWKDTRYIYDGKQVLMEEDQQGKLLRRFIYGAGIDEPVAMMSRYPGGEGDALQIFYHHFDVRSSTRFLTDKNGQLVETFHYGPFGETSVTSHIKTTPFQYTSRRYDEETGLYYYRARYYDPALGRFIQPDPAGYAEGLNLYTYVSNDPINFVDPLGLTRNAVRSRALSIGNEFNKTFNAASNVPGIQVTQAGGAAGAAARFAAVTGTAGIIATSLELGAISTGELPSFRGATKSAASQLAKNKAVGDAFEKQVMGQLQQTQSGVVQQVTVKTQRGVRTRIDLMGRDANGNIVCTECKASATAPLTKNQTAAFPEIQKTGATVVGQGKPGFPGGTQIPPTTINIVRP